ncbi:methyltransferase domain-containing protein [Candidatus Halobeggiatoa sp. HSG11]|nr:methyltransferase domain-containing protein [Candidatus Halobeggiatoa sp. HSG11]
MSDYTVQLNRWFETPLGRRLLCAETEMLQQILPHLFGYHLLQISNIGHSNLLKSSLIKHRCILSMYANIVDSPYTSIYGLADALPIAHDTIDVVVLPHVLEFETNPHEILREIERVLIPEGHLVILGFNPISLWGMRMRRNVPWNGKFLSLLRLKDWLALLNFEVIEQHIFFFAVPFRNDRLKKYTAVIEKIGSRWTKNFGAVYILVAKKRVATLTPIKQRWLAQPAMITEAIGTSFKQK